MENHSPFKTNVKKKKEQTKPKVENFNTLSHQESRQNTKISIKKNKKTYWEPERAALVVVEGQEETLKEAISRKKKNSRFYTHEAISLFSLYL